MSLKILEKKLVRIEKRIEKIKMGKILLKN